MRFVGLSVVLDFRSWRNGGIDGPARCFLLLHLLLHLQKELVSLGWWWCWKWRWRERLYSLTASQELLGSTLLYAHWDWKSWSTCSRSDQGQAVSQPEVELACRRSCRG